MSQPRMRKAPVAVACNGSRPRAAAINKASGDPGPCIRAQKQQHEKRSKNNIPKSIRYDLENALVGLCDVWFEEIKPHLVRNKIKLHVHSGPGPAGGDHRRLPPGAAGCSHLDPGAASDHCPRPAANCAGCCSTPPTASRAPSLRLPMRQVHSRSRLLLPSPALALSSPLTNQNLNSKGDRKRKHRSQRHRRFSKPPSSQATWRVPRLCRTYIALSPPATPKTILRKIQTATQTKQRRDNELINIIGEKHDKRLKLLYKSPIREECSSILNLVQTPKDCPIEGDSRKKKPWR